MSEIPSEWEQFEAAQLPSWVTGKKKDERKSAPTNAGKRARVLGSHSPRVQLRRRYWVPSRPLSRTGLRDEHEHRIIAQARFRPLPVREMLQAYYRRPFSELLGDHLAD